jgi:hypothetical protein
MKILTKNELERETAAALEPSADGVKVRDEKDLRSRLIDDLVMTAVFGDAETAAGARWTIRAAGERLGVIPASIQGLYEAMGRGEAGGFTVPAVNIRTLTYDMARALFREAGKIDCGAFIFEIARSEMGYTRQEPAEYAASVLAAALKEGWHGPVFIQGDHVQVSSSRYKADPEKELADIEDLIRREVLAGFYNIDIDASTMVDLSREGHGEQQKLNCELTARLMKLIRSIEPGGTTISIGAEIGEVGGRNSTPEEFEAFMEGLAAALGGRGAGPSISKISVQTGTSHGGIPLPGGGVADVELDFGVLERIGKLARSKYGLSGSVQHGASTLPEELFDRFPGSCTSEIHLATGFQNIFYEHPALPAGLRDEMVDYVKTSHGPEKKTGETETQFIYRMRKNALGPFKKRIWELPPGVRGEIVKTLEGKFSIILDKLSLAGTRVAVEKHVRPRGFVPPLELFLRDTRKKSSVSVEGE